MGSGARRAGVILFGSGATLRPPDTQIHVNRLFIRGGFGEDDMNNVLYFLLGALALVLIVNLAWRLASGRHPIPCPAWLAWMVELDNPVFRENRARVILSHLDLRPGMRVLDYGCGPGRLTLPLARLVGAQGQVTALDLQAKMLEKLRAKAMAENLVNICYLQASAGEASLDAESYDMALLVTVLGELPDQARALKEIYASLKSGGVLSVTELVADPHFQKHQKATRLAEAAGFREAGFFGRPLSYTLHLKKS